MFSYTAPKFSQPSAACMQYITKSFSELSVSYSGLYLFYIQEEYKTVYLAIGGVLNNVTHFNVTRLCRNSSQIVSDWSSRRGGSIYTTVAELGGANWWQIKTFFAVGAYSLNFTIVN